MDAALTNNQINMFLKNKFSESFKFENVIKKNKANNLTITDRVEIFFQDIYKRIDLKKIKQNKIPGNETLTISAQKEKINFSNKELTMRVGVLATIIYHQERESSPWLTLLQDLISPIYKVEREREYEEFKHKMIAALK